ncbi:gp047 [Rhodococcus phage ReqiPepy6]|uniref:Gp047 n=1 Tax=Rhodococcus phage ReqiPepy6 TaxID=691965 RepID=D4P7F8_9CAUD|nr:gp047 [Rhodococcus phage ReqiPepy6]ADD80938.1 gp047 [Rhodococcus phage ReqiPepy6]
MINELNAIKQIVVNNPTVVKATLAAAGLAVGTTVAYRIKKKEALLAGGAQWMSVEQYEQHVADNEGVDRNDLLEDEYVVIDPQ